MRGSGRILFVEDDELVREAVVHGLEEAGFEVLVAANGERALAMMEAGLDIDVVFDVLATRGERATARPAKGHTHRRRNSLATQRDTAVRESR